MSSRNGQANKLKLTTIWVTRWCRGNTKTFQLADGNALRTSFAVLPRSSLESSLGGLWFLCAAIFEVCELLLVLLMLFMFNKLCCGGPPKWGRVKKGANIGMPNCRNGAQGRDRGAKWAATAASWRAGCKFELPDMLDNIFWCPKTIINNGWTVVKFHCLFLCIHREYSSLIQRRHSKFPFLIKKFHFKLIMHSHNSRLTKCLFLVTFN
jgi:hypothetical protein